MKANLEDKLERINPVDPAEVRVVQITDCHIFATADECLQGLNTRHSFERVSNAALSNPGNLDLLLATGDLSQDESATAYEYLAGQFEQFGIPVFWLPGNHDDIDTMGEHLTGKQTFHAKRVLVGGWQIVLLDSTIKGEVHGRVSEDQLEFLDKALNEYPHRHALVCLHHQAIDCGSEWLDAKGLKDNDKLRKRISEHANVRAVLWGHVHQETHQTIDNIEWMSTPSSCVQFKPNSREFAIGPEAPGYRQLELYPDGTIKTVVHRLQQL